MLAITKQLQQKDMSYSADRIDTTDGDAFTSFAYVLIVFICMQRNSLIRMHNTYVIKFMTFKELQSKYRILLVFVV